MKFTIDRTELLSALSKTVPVIGKSHLPILEHVKVDAQADRLVISANNLETAITAFIPCEILATGSVCVPAKRLLDVVKSCPTGPIACELSMALRLKIVAGSANFTVACLSADDWPAMPTVPAPAHDWASVDPATVADAFERVIYAAHTDESTHNLYTMNIEPLGEGCQLTTTDGHRLARAPMAISLDFGDRKSAMIPNRSASQMAKLLMSAKDKVQLAIDDKNLILLGGNTVATFRLVDGEYPNTNAVVPESTAITVEAPREALLNAIARTNLFTSERSVGITVDVGANEIRLTSQTDAGEGQDSVSVEYAGDPIAFLVNGSYFAEALRHIDTDGVGLEFVDAEMDATPFLVRPTEGDYFHLVMPMRK